MGYIEEAMRKNPKAAQQLEEIKDIFGTLKELREAGIARGSNLCPFRSSQSLRELDVSSSARGRLKLSISG